MEEEVEVVVVGVGVEALDGAGEEGAEAAAGAEELITRRSMETREDEEVEAVGVEVTTKRIMAIETEVVGLRGVGTCTTPWSLWTVQGMGRTSN